MKILVKTPQEIVAALNNHIVGQKEAKYAVANALRYRYRRMKVKEYDPELGIEITPKNILMIGPTGVGKTEIARRLAKLANAPFIKVEATKFTEVGYVGRDVESIIRDLVDISVKLTRAQAIEKVQKRSQSAAEERILNTLASKLPKPESFDRNTTLKQLKAGKLDEEEIELEVLSSLIGIEIVAPPGMEEMTNQLQGLFENLSGNRTKRKKLKIKDALKLLQEEEAAKLINDDDIKMQALERVEQSGIVFLDEIDKVTHRVEDKRSGSDVSREGVQRDLLPLIEGCSVSTRYGPVKTDHILFIASGAFSLSKPSDLIPELQGRLPVRVELKALKTEDFVRILTEPKASLTDQYKALLGTENVKIKFLKDGIQRLAEIAWEVNEKTENIGARRLYTVIERLLEEISFHASEKSGQTISITKAYVNKQLNTLIKDEDLSRFIL